jgi:hypothetical protein
MSLSENVKLQILHRFTHRPSRSEAWPNLFIAGAAKAGTTSLYAVLDGHAGFHCPSLKEPHFFSSVPPLHEGTGYVPKVENVDEYLKLYVPGARCRYRVDASTSYLWDPFSAQRIRSTCPRTPRVVILLRDPVQRSYSHYLNNVSEGWERRSFGNAVRDELSAGDGCRWNDAYIGGSRYSRQLPAFLTAFGNALWIGFFEEFTQQSERFLIDLSAFLAIDLTEDGDRGSEARNPYTVPRNRLFGKVFHSRAARETSRQIVPSTARGWLRSVMLTPGEKPPLEAADEDLLRAELGNEYERVPQLLRKATPWN